MQIQRCEKWFRTSALAVMVFLVGCGTSAQITSSWVDPEITPQDLDGVLVIAVTGKTPDHQEVRADFERAFAKELNDRGVRAVASYTVLKNTSSKDEVLTVANKLKLDTILVTRYAGTVSEDVYHEGDSYYAYAPVYNSGYDGGFGGYYGRIYKVYQEPDVWTTNSYVSVISDLYETATEKRIWEASSNAIDPGDMTELRDAFISAFVDEMTRDKLLGK